MGIHAPFCMRLVGYSKESSELFGAELQVAECIELPPVLRGTC